MDSLGWGILLAGRILPTLLLVPALGGQRLPLPVKLVLAALLAWALLPVARVAAPLPDGPRWVLLLAKELAAGTVLAFAASCLLEAFRMAGEWIDLARGAGQATINLGAEEQPASSLGALYLLLACTVFFEIGGPGLFVQALQESLARFPLATWPAEPIGSRWLESTMAVLGGAFRYGLGLALPALTTLLLVDLLLGFMNRVAAQLPVFFLGLPLKALVGIGLGMLTLGWVREGLGGLLSALGGPG
jgi:flagellar biosynthetic protein FliR